MKVLVITYYWPPSGGSGVQRWLKTSKYLPQYGWEPVVCTPENPDVNSVDESLMKDVPADLTVIKRKITEPYGFYKVLTGKKKGEHLQANIISSSSGGSRSMLQKISMHIRANWFIPDPRCWWIKPSVRYLSRIIDGKGNADGGLHFDAVISTGPPHSMHLIAREIHKRFNIPWIADFRDPWTNIFYFKHLGLSAKSLRKHKSLERSVIAEADCVTVVSEQMKKEFSEGDFEAFKNKVHVIPNGYDPDDFDTQKNPELDKLYRSVLEMAEGKFLVVHTGLMPENANPDRFWKVLGEMAASDSPFKERLMIVTMGQTDASVKKDIAENGLEGNYSDLGYVSHSTSIAWQKRADILLLPLRKEKESKAILTGKFFEYLASGNNILAFGPTDGDLARELEKTGSGIICGFDDEDAIRYAFEKLCTPGTPTLQQTENRKKYSRASGAERFAGLLDQIKK